MINIRHLNLMKIQAQALILFIQNPNLTSHHLRNTIKTNINFTKLGLELAIEAFEKYTKNESPIKDEIKALREDLIIFERSL